MTRDAERDDDTGHTPRSGWEVSKYRHQKIVVKTLRKRCKSFCFYDALYVLARGTRSKYPFFLAEQIY